LIKEYLRGLPWSIGVMEYWNDGLRRRRTIDYPNPDGMMEYWKGGIVASKAHDLGLVRQVTLTDNAVLQKLRELQFKIA
jgi:hypothetical protein